MQFVDLTFGRIFRPLPLIPFRYLFNCPFDFHPYAFVDLHLQQADDSGVLRDAPEQDMAT